MNRAAGQLDNSAGRLRAASRREQALSQLQQSRSAINRSQQAAQSRGAGQRGQGAQAGSGLGDGMDDDFGGSSMGDEGEGGSGERPGGSGAGSGSGSGSDMIYDPGITIGTPSFVPGASQFNPDDAFESPGLDSAFGNEAQVPYKQAFAEYEKRATNTLQSSYIPAGLKDVVKDYFSSLAPNNSK
jgi:hypothetical protein